MLGKEERGEVCLWAEYESPIGKLLLGADNEGLCRISFNSPSHYGKSMRPEKSDDTLKSVIRWLDIYFAGKKPDFMPQLHLSGTEFQILVWKILLTVSYGKTMTYGEIAKLVAAELGGKKMSAQAVGGAVGRNPILIIVPCHRVIGAGDKLGGYAAGPELKRWLLSWESRRSFDEKKI